jgi:hypothetical protein
MTKTDREIELEKKLSIAVKALRYYANSNCWDDCFYNGRIKVSAYLQTAGYKTAQQALKEISVSDAGRNTKTCALQTSLATNRKRF